MKNNNNKTIKELQNENFFVEVYHGRTHVNNEDGSVVITSRRDARLSGLTDTHTVFCKGGFTYLKLTDKNGVEVIGKCNFSNNRHFHRKHGLKVAIARALAKLEVA